MGKRGQWWKKNRTYKKFCFSLALRCSTLNFLYLISHACQRRLRRCCR